MMTTILYNGTTPLFWGMCILTIMVVLGNRNLDDGSMSQAGLYRVRLALDIIKQNTVDKVILSGGIANTKANVSEAQLMHDWLTYHGVDSDMLIKEEQSLTTQQNAKYCAAILSHMPTVDKVILVTSADHMQRPFLNPIKLFAKALPSNITIIPRSKGATL